MKPMCNLLLAMSVCLLAWGARDAGAEQVEVTFGWDPGLSYVPPFGIVETGPPLALGHLVFDDSVANPLVHLRFGPVLNFASSSYVQTHDGVSTGTWFGPFGEPLIGGLLFEGYGKATAWNRTLPDLFARSSMTYFEGGPSATNYHGYGAGTVSWTQSIRLDGTLGDPAGRGPGWARDGTVSFSDWTLNLALQIENRYGSVTNSYGYGANTKVISVQAQVDAGQNASNPLLPVSQTGHTFGFNSSSMLSINGTNFRGGYYDPDVAVGYTFEAANTATTFGKVMVPNDYGDGSFNLFTWDDASGTFVDSGIKLTKGVWLDFDAALGTTGGTRKFRITGIETSAMVDPGDPGGFVTGLTFTGAGNAFTMSAMTEFVAAPPVPEPATSLLCLAGLAVVALSARHRSKATQPLFT